MPNQTNIKDIKKEEKIINWESPEPIKKMLEENPSQLVTQNDKKDNVLNAELAKNLENGSIKKELIKKYIKWACQPLNTIIRFFKRVFFWSKSATQETFLINELQKHIDKKSEQTPPTQTQTLRPILEQTLPPQTPALAPILEQTPPAQTPALTPILEQTPPAQTPALTPILEQTPSTQINAPKKMSIVKKNTIAKTESSPTFSNLQTLYPKGIPEFILYKKEIYLIEESKKICKLKADNTGIGWTEAFLRLSKFDECKKFSNEKHEAFLMCCGFNSFEQKPDFLPIEHNTQSHFSPIRCS